MLKYKVVMLAIVMLGLGSGSTTLYIGHKVQEQAKVVEQYRTQVVQLQAQIAGEELTAVTPVALPDTTPKVITNTVTRTVTVHAPEDQDTIESLKEQLKAVQGQNEALQVRLDTLNAKLNAKVYTKDQLSAQYMTLHPKPVCNTTGMDSRVAVSYCNKLYTDWSTEVNAWVNAELAKQ